MKRTSIFFLVLLVLVLLFCFDTELYAGPGGKIAKTIVKSFWGKIFLGILFVVLLPIIIPMMIRHHLKVRRTRKAIMQLGTKSDYFDWFTLRNRVKDVFLNVHRAWKKEDMSLASDYMTSWYWQNQQLVYLEEWEEKGLVNICRVQEVLNITPIHIDVKNAPSYEGSRVFFSIKAHMEDYLKNKKTEEVVEGEKGFKDVETVWTFVLQNGKWVVESIEEASYVKEIVKLPNRIPALVAE